MRFERMNQTIEEHFRGALPIENFVNVITEHGKEMGVETSAIKPFLSLCRDDSTAELDHVLSEQGYLAPFHAHTLTGLPVSGLTSVGAWYHHIPDEGLGVVIYAPHIGVDKEGTLGALNRAGISAVGKSCGAAHAILDYFKASGIPPDERELADVASHLDKEEILAKETPLMEITEQLYHEGVRILQEQLSKIQKQEEHHHPILLVAGIHIDTPQQEGCPNKFQIRETYMIKNGEAHEFQR